MKDPSTRRFPGRLLMTLVLTAAALVVVVSEAPAAEAKAPFERVIILGFDGADAHLVSQYMDEGRLPNLSKLKAQGFYSPLRPTNPPQTPVSWSTFATGLNPGRTEIFDFLKRIEGTYIPDFAMVKEGKKTLLFGPRNPPILGAAAGIAAALVAAIVLALLKQRGLRLAGFALLVGGLAGSGMALMASRWLPNELPDAANGRKGTPFWTVAAEAGIPSRVIHVPANFPAESHDHLELLSGLGVPDMRGRVGSSCLFTSDAAFDLPDNQFSVEVVHLSGRRGRIETAVVGPQNKPFWNYPRDAATANLKGDEKRAAREKFEADLARRGVKQRLDVPFAIEATEQDLTIDLGGRRETLKPDSWSGWFEVPIAVNPLIDRVAGLRGLVRFKLLALDPEIRLYMSPINFHPLCQPLPFATPKSLAPELLDEVGLFKTLGWPIDTWSLPSGITDEKHFLEDLDFTVATEVKMLDGALARGDARLYVQVFDFPDRVGHMLWRLHDPGHPLYDAGLAARYAGEIPKAYERMDAIVGRAMAKLDGKTALVVCSDHGFASFRRGINYNTWLWKNGFMSLKGVGTGREAGGKTLEDLFDKKELGSFFKNVDWPRTKAYAIGLGNVYVNLLGREPNGSVAPGREYEEVRAAIVKGLEALVDEKTGEKPVVKVYTREEMYTGFDPRIMPDLRVANSDHYRVGWQGTLGEISNDVLEDNRKAWSGDHCSNDPSLVPGIFFSSFPLKQDSAPFIGDLFPTTLALLGVPPVAGIDGRSLLP
jgi:predicted AlkP superfamily phosphohydrolase/phosphomutase